MLPVESRLLLKACVDRCRTDRSIDEVEFPFDDVKGDQRWFLAKFLPTESGKLHCMFLDISALKAREERNTLILGEFAHRIKNNMMMVQAIARLTLKATQPNEQAFAIFQARLAALANAQNLLIRNDWHGAFLFDVVIEAIKPFDRDGSPFHVSGDTVFISSRLAKAIMFALHELSTNAMKYGALGTACGEVFISWRVAQVDEERTLIFRWQERQGPAIREAPSHRGFGTRMIERWLAREAGGKATLAYREEGLAFEFRAPVPSIEDAGCYEERLEECSLRGQMSRPSLGHERAVSRWMGCSTNNRNNAIGSDI